MDLRVPEMTAFDAAQQLIAALVYLAVGVAAVAQAPRDRRTHVFLWFSVANAVAFGVTILSWYLGVKNPLDMHRAWHALSISALGVGALLLFHFSQIFPRRRPWIKGSGLQLPAAYILTPVVVCALASFWPADPAKITLTFVAIFLIFGFPLLVLLGFVLPVAAILSFIRSYREAAVDTGLPDARPVLAGILLSQVAGGVLAIVFAPVLAAIAPDSYAFEFVTLTMWALSLLTPVAFAAGVWKYRLLDIDPGATQL